MADGNALTFNTAPSPAAEDERTLVIDQEKLSSQIRDYLQLLVKQNPSYTKEIKINRSHIEESLEPHLPKIPGQEAESREVRNLISRELESLPVVGPTSEIRVRISIQASPTSPPALSEPNEAVAVITFDAVAGILRRATIKAHEQPPALDDMGIASGLIVVSQPIVPTINPLTNDERLFQKGTETNLYSERNRDVRLTGDDALPIPFAFPSPTPEPQEVIDRRKVLRRYSEENQLRDAEEDTLLAAGAAAGAYLLGNQEQNRLRDEQTQLRNQTELQAQQQLTPQPQQQSQQEERRADELHDRRGSPHERRGPNRTEGFVRGVTTIAGLPVERYEGALYEGNPALLGRETAATENEVTGTQTGLGFTPQRPEEGITAPSIENIPASETPNASPFAPPAAAIAAAAATGQALEAATVVSGAPGNVQTPGNVFVERRRQARTPQTIQTTQAQTVQEQTAQPAAQAQAILTQGAPTQAAGASLAAEQERTTALNNDRRETEYYREQEVARTQARQDQAQREATQEAQSQTNAPPAFSQRERERQERAEYERARREDQRRDETLYRSTTQQTSGVPFGAREAATGGGIGVVRNGGRFEQAQHNEELRRRNEEDARRASAMAERREPNIMERAIRDEFLKTEEPPTPVQGAGIYPFAGRDERTDRPTFNAATDTAARRDFGIWGSVRAAASNLSDATLAALAALGSPAARDAYQQRMAQRQSEASEEERDEMREGLREERKREHEAAEQNQQDIKNSATAKKQPGPKPDDLTLDE